MANRGEYTDNTGIERRRGAVVAEATFVPRGLLFLDEARVPTAPIPS
jgi:hypothetical protein